MDISGVALIWSREKAGAIVNGLRLYLEANREAQISIKQAIK
jgi:hypothetical protein